MILAANFKTNHTRSSTQKYLNDLQNFAQKSSHSFYIFPPATALSESTPDVRVGVQNAFFASKGSFTGEIGLEQLQEFGTKTILIGHSERRHVIGEDLDMVRKKFDFFAQEGFEIFFCIGEKLPTKQEGEASVMRYLQSQLDGIDVSYEKLILAYEPVWAIGTGVSATNSDIETVHKNIKDLSDKPLLYGGSVNEKNFAQIAQIPNVDGVLVGTASWSLEKFLTMIG